jgi:hypothetical protein
MVEADTGDAIIWLMDMEGALIFSAQFPNGYSESAAIQERTTRIVTNIVYIAGLPSLKRLQFVQFRC